MKATISTAVEVTRESGAILRVRVSPDGDLRFFNGLFAVTVSPQELADSLDLLNVQLPPPTQR